MFRHLLALGALGAAVAIPYLSSGAKDRLDKASSWLSSRGGSADDVATLPDPAAIGPLPRRTPTGPGVPTQPHEPYLEGPPTQDLGEVFNFEASIPWVMQRWRRVSTGLVEGELQGYRVPLVTGTSIGDLAGSLTYYFDRKQQVQRITFYGASGDPRRLVTLVTGKFGFRREQGREAGTVVFTDRWSGKPRGQLVLRPPAIVRGTQPQARYAIDLYIGRQ
jgi:hypothetical protein